MTSSVVMRRVFAAAALAAAVAGPVAKGHADPCDPVAQVFSGDPCDPVTGPYPMLPGLPLVLPPKGPNAHWNDGPPLVDRSFTGDVDLAVRVGTFLSETEVPPPAGSTSTPALLQNVAGGGGNSQGSAVDFTVFVTDGPGVKPFGSPLAGLDRRPLAVFGYADLDGDGRIGPSDVDGKADNQIEKQEAIGHVGRQVGQIDVDRFHNSVAVRIAAPASIGGLRVALVAGMYTGDDPGLLWSNGTPIFTNWPFFPPLDPLAVVYLAEANPPDPNGPNIIFYQPSEFLLPDPSTPDLVDSFVVRVDGSNPSIDQFVSISGPAVGVRFFRDVDPAKFTASSRLVIRPAPALLGTARRMVTPAGEVAVKTGRDVKFRLLPVDALGNIADPGPEGVPARIIAEDGLRILSPDADNDTSVETLNVDSARGVLIKVDTQNANGRAKLTLFDPPPALPTGLDQAIVFASESGDVDADDDGILDDGDSSGTIGDHPCTAADMTGRVPCDDNCPDVVNPSQNDSDGDGQGNCCDGACVINDSNSGCMECPQSASRFRAVTSKARLALRPRAGITPDGLRLRTVLRMQEGQSLAPDSEQVEVTIAEGDRLHYFVQLPGVFTLVPTEKGPNWEYEDDAGTIAGIYRAHLRSRAHGIRARFQARGLNLLDTNPAEELPNGLVVAITVGDDTFTRHLKCSSQFSVIRCVSSD